MMLSDIVSQKSGNSNMPSVSIIIPVFKAEQYIERCARSLFSQSFRDIEFIFVNDASPDRSIEILDSVIKLYPDRMSQCIIYNNTENSGSSESRNIGLKLASGKYIVFCDSDDWMEQDMVAEMYYAAENKHADIIYCNFMIEKQDSTDMFRCVEWQNNKESFLKQYLMFPWNVVWNIMVRHDLYKTRKIEFPISFNFCEDLYVSFRLYFFADKIIHLDRYLYHYNQMNQSSIVHAMDSRVRFEDEINSYGAMIEFMKDQNIYKAYSRYIYWKVINAKQDFLLNTGTFNRFLDTVPESNNYILDCPYVNIKIKIMGWLLVHDMKSVLLLIIRLRNRLKKS